MEFAKYAECPSNVQDDVMKARAEKLAKEE